VLIYFDSETIRQVIASLRRRLVPGGWLLLGHAENSPELKVGFQAHSARGTVLYQKLAGPAWDTSPAPASVPSTAPLPPLSPPAASFGTAPLNKLAQWRPYPLEVPDTSVEPAPVASITPRPPAAAAMPPEEPVTEIQRLRFLANSGSWQEADACSAALLRQEPLNPLAHFYRGLVLGQTGRQAAAEEALRKALFLEPDLGLAYYQLGLLLSARGDRAGAARAFRNTLRAVEPLPGEAVLDGADLTAAQLREAASLHLREPGA
jgi:chemotaxis protein methyltransferase CheR